MGSRPVDLGRRPAQRSTHRSAAQCGRKARCAGKQCIELAIGGKGFLDRFSLVLPTGHVAAFMRDDIEDRRKDDGQGPDRCRRATAPPVL